MIERKILGESNLRVPGVLLIPNRCGIEQIKTIEKLLGLDRLVFLIESEVKLSAEIDEHFKQVKAKGLVFNAKDPEPETVGKKLRDEIKDNKFLIYIPGNVNSQPAGLHQLCTEVGKFLFATNLRILPLYFSENFNTLMSRIYPAQPILSINEPVDNLAELIQSWMLSEEMWLDKHPALQRSLAEGIIYGIKSFPHGRLIDGTDDSSTPYLKLLAAALAFGKFLDKLTNNPRIGIILPPGKACTLANMACVLVGKIPVNINFTASHASFQSACKLAKIDHFITADAFVSKLSDFAWPPVRDRIYIERELPNLANAIKGHYLFCRYMPAKWIIKRYKLDLHKNLEECQLLFTSGSSNEPKGVSLTHKNILANIIQCASRLALPEGSRILGCLPIFHSFGSTITVWFPILEGIDTVTYVSPLESKRIGELIQTYEVNFVMLTPTFLRGILRRCPKDSLKSVHMLVTGAEKLPLSLAESFEKRFSITPLEGYGLTETSPVCSFNQANLPTHSSQRTIPSHRPSSVGHLIPGVAIRITSVFDDSVIPPNQRGMIWFKGPNVFEGYLNNPEATANAIEDGWFKTGDIGHLDDEGFLYIEGRIGRFSKSGGEMIPHEQVELAVAKALNIDPADPERKIAIVGVPDPTKGEVLALISTLISPQGAYNELQVLRYKLIDLKIPNLWIPRHIVPATNIPLLPSGKLDLRKCKSIAETYLKIKPE